jgi:hypothetical protein
MAGLFDNEFKIASTPFWTAKLGAAIRSRLRRDRFSPTVFDVITIDENVDGTLELSLTPLDKPLEKILDHEQS